jgi:hypothetical protein
LYYAIMTAVGTSLVNLPPGVAVIAICVLVDKGAGVWEAPTSRALSSIKAPTVRVNNSQHDELDVDPLEGKLINSCASFQEKEQCSGVHER